MHIVDKILDEEKGTIEAPPTTLSRQEVVHGAIVGPGAFPINSPVGGGNTCDEESESTQEPPSIVHDEEQPSPCYLAEASIVTEGRSRSEPPQNATAVMEVYEGAVVVPSTNKENQATNVKNRPPSWSRRQIVALVLIVVVITSLVAGGATYFALKKSSGGSESEHSKDDPIPPPEGAIVNCTKQGKPCKPPDRH